MLPLEQFCITGFDPLFQNNGKSTDENAPITVYTYYQQYLFQVNPDIETTENVYIPLMRDIVVCY